MSPKHGAELLSTACKCKKAMKNLLEKNMCVASFPSGMSYSVIGHEFDVYESTVYILKGVFKRKTYKTRFVQTWTRGLQEPNAALLQEWWFSIH